MIFTLTQLATCTGASEPRAQMFLPYIQAAMDAFEIGTEDRAPAFLAQVGHESGNLRWTTELWGPTPAQARYERDFDESWPPPDRHARNWLAYELGNAQAGDGSRFRGHGLLQVTGRANHAAARDHLRQRFGMRVPDFEAEPTRLAEPEWAALSAGDFWVRHGLNELADAGDFLAITRRINGGTNGYESRVALWENGKAALA